MKDDFSIIQDFCRFTIVDSSNPEVERATYKLQWISASRFCQDTRSFWVVCFEGLQASITLKIEITSDLSDPRSLVVQRAWKNGDGDKFVPKSPRTPLFSSSIVREASASPGTRFPPPSFASFHSPPPPVVDKEDDDPFAASSSIYHGFRRHRRTPSSPSSSSSEDDEEKKTEADVVDPIKSSRLPGAKKPPPMAATFSTTTKTVTTEEKRSRMETEDVVLRRWWKVWGCSIEN